MPPINHDCKSVLIIEDDHGIRETLKFALELEGYHVFTAADGKQGLDLLPGIPKPCVILLDLMMPVMNGWEFVEAIEENVTLATIPVIVVTAFSDKANSVRSQGIIKKPVDLDALYKAVGRWCGGTHGSDSNATPNPSAQ